jgi:hypothetical protein
VAEPAEQNEDENVNLNKDDLNIGSALAPPKNEKKNIRIQKKDNINADKIKRHLFGTGYKSYTNILNLGNIEELIGNDSGLLKDQIKIFLDKLENNKTYSVLSVVRWSDSSGVSSGVTTNDSIKITGSGWRSLGGRRSPRPRSESQSRSHWLWLRPGSARPRPKMLI